MELQESSLTPYEKMELYNVTFNANGGIYEDEKESFVIEEWKIGDEENLKKPTRNRFEFVGYFTNKEGGTSLEKYIAEAGIDGDLTFYAQWKEIKEEINLIHPHPSLRATLSHQGRGVENLLKLNINGFDVYIGRNNKQNDFIISKLSKDEDYWFHTRLCAGSHVLLKIKETEPDEETLFECCKLAREYSSAKQPSKVGVIYTKRKHIKKPPASPLGYVIYKNEKEILV